MRQHVRSRMWRHGVTLRALLIVLLFLGILLWIFVSQFRHAVIPLSSSHTADRPDMARGLSWYLSSVEDRTKHNRTRLKPNDTLAQHVRSKLKVLCLIFTTEEQLSVRGRAILHTWARRCNGYKFALRTRKRRTNIINLDIGWSRQSRMKAVLQALQSIYDNHKDDFDWILTSDDESFIIVENLRFLLSFYNRNVPSYLKHRTMKSFTGDADINRGDVGFIISSGGLRHLFEYGGMNTICSSISYVYGAGFVGDGHVMDLEDCLSDSGVSRISSLDIHGKETIHPFYVQDYLDGIINPNAFQDMKDPSSRDMRCCSRYTFSLQHVVPEMMVMIEHLLYRTSVYLRDDPLTNPDFFEIHTLGAAVAN